MASWRWMVGRFCLYGFLKNLRFFDVFLLLILRQRGLSFLQIGALVSIRELTVLVLEIPSGILADLFGRRRTLIFSFAASIGSFIVYRLAPSFAWFVPAVILFGAGEALRSGTHKAIIMEYLDIMRAPDRAVALHGITRSWEQIGSALCAVIGAVLVFSSGDFGVVFAATAIPYAVVLILLLTYPIELDGQRGGARSWKDVRSFIENTVRDCWKTRPLRIGLLNSALGKGLYKVTKDYLQPVLKGNAYLLLPVLAPLFPDATGEQATAVAVGVVYSLIYLGSAQVSRRARVIEHSLGGPERTLNCSYLLFLIVSASALIALSFTLDWLAIIAFLLLALVDNLRRPVLSSYLGAFADRAQRATVYSVESQLESLVAIGVAPIIGFLADRVGVAGVFALSVGFFGACGYLLRIRREQDAAR